MSELQIRPESLTKKETINSGQMSPTFTPNKRVVHLKGDVSGFTTTQVETGDISNKKEARKETDDSGLPLITM